MKMDIIFVFVIFAIIITCECNENGNDNSNTGYLSVKIHALELELKSLQLEFTAIGLRYQQLDTKFGTTGYHLEESPSTLNFGEWTEWSECDVSCGDGNQKRYKFCTESQMSVEGGECSSITVQSRKCNKTFCPGEWTEWSECDVSCGDGNQKRYKFCTESQMSVEGGGCSGVSVQSRKCNTKLCPVPIKDCTDVEGRSGVYSIHPLGVENPFDVYCGMDTDGGRWTVFQRRKDGSEIFYRGWRDYENGFGLLEEEFWLGNMNIHNITRQGHYELRVDLGDWDGNTAYAQYSTFSLGDNSTEYNLTVEGYSGTAEVFNLARGQTTHLSTTLDKLWISSKAVDGRRDCPGICTSTADPDRHWWVDLGKLSVIKKINLFNRNICVERLANITVEIGVTLENLYPCAYYEGPAGPSENVELQFSRRIIGQFVKISGGGASSEQKCHPGIIYLSFCEAEVYGFYL